jgi:hypothetical protein
MQSFQNEISSSDSNLGKQFPYLFLLFFSQIDNVFENEIVIGFCEID